MYRILYNDSTIFDPYGNENEVVTDASMSVEINAAAYMDFTMSRLHPLYNTIAERDGVVTLYWDRNVLFQGVIESIDIDIQGNKAVSCVSALDYLNDTVVRPYSTIAGEQELTAPSSVDGYFQWLIDQHNEHVLDSGKRFDVGVNQGANLQQNNFIYRSSTNNPTTASEISDQLLDALGGYLTMRYVDDRYVLDLYADLHTMNTQIVDFGVNITDFSKTIDTKDQYTALILKGGSPEFQGGDFESGDWSHWVTHPNEPLVGDKTHGGDVSSYFVSGAGEYVNDSFFYFRSGRRYKATVYVKNERGSNVTIHGSYQYEQSGTWTTVNVGTSLIVENKDDQWVEFSFDFQPNLSDYSKIRPRWYFDNVANDSNRRVYLDDFSFSQVSGDTNVAEDPISVFMVPDGGTQYDSNILKTGDVIYDPSSVSRYGYKEEMYEDSTITDVDDLLQAGIKELNKLKDPQIGLDIKAVDLALFMEGYTHLNVGDAVRVRSAIHDTDEFLMVNSITLDLQDPGQSEYNIGKAYDSLTGQQSGFLRSLNSGINSSLDAVASLDQTTKDQAIQIGNVEQVANDASEKADNAQNTANSNKEEIGSIKDAQTEYEKQLEQMQQGVADVTEEIGQVNERIDGMNSEIESAKSDIDSLRSSTETELQNVKQSVSKVQSDVESVTQKASDLASELDGTKATVEQVVTEQGEIKSSVSNAVEKADQSLQVSTQASQTATQAQTTATSAYRDAQSALTQSSTASQTANAVKTELETKYSTTDEIAEQYATKSLVEQTSQSITSTVEATYATKATVEALENIANNAVQTWMGSGVPTLSNKPASDWTTAELKSQHSGDIYYDSNTGYSYRFGSSDGSDYSWSLIKDTDISKAVADAAKAQQTAEGVSDEVTQLKTDIPATYATKTEVKQTTDSIKSTVSEVAATANSALSKATTVEQTANGLQTTVTEQAEKLDGAVTTISQVSQKVDSVSSTITQVSKTEQNGLIRNGGFETGDMTGWTYAFPGTTAVIERRTNAGEIGDYLCRFYRPSDNKDWTGIASEYFPIIAGHTYQITVAAFYSDAARETAVGLRLESGGYLQRAITTNLGGDGTWHQLSGIVKMTSGNSARFEIDANGTTSETSRILFDGVSVIDVTEGKTANDTANSALSKSSSVEQNLDSFKTNVSQTYETKSDALNKQSSLQQSVNNLRTEVSETYTTKTEFDNLQIGGTNLIRNSNFSDSHSDWSNWGSPSTREIVTINSKTWAHIVTSKQASNGYQGYQQRTLASQTIYGGESYTFSCLAYAGDSASSKFTVGIHMSLSNQQILDQFWHTDDTLGSDPKRIVYTFAIPENCEQFNVMVGYNKTDSVQNIYFTDIKLEVGAKPTDWSPAPEDLLTDAEAAKTYSTKSYVDQTARTVSLGVVEEYKNGQHGSALATQSDITAATDSITSTVSQTYATKNEFNNLQVGGTNIARDTQAFGHNGVSSTEEGYLKGYVNRTNGTYKGLTVRNIISSDGTNVTVCEYLVTNVKHSEYYTLSFWAKGSGKIRAYFYGPSGYIAAKAVSASNGSGNTAFSDGAWNMTVSSSWQRYFVVYQTAPSGGTSTDKYMLLRNDNDMASCDICGVMIERGNKASDWSPSPLDVSATYATKTEVKQTSDSLTVSISSATSKAESAATAASKAQSTANTASTNATNANNRVGNLETCIKMTSDGVRVGKISNGNFTGYSALVNSAGSFDILDSSTKTLASFNKDGLRVYSSSDRGMIIGFNPNTNSGYIGSTPRSTSIGEDYVDIGMNMDFSSGGDLSIIDRLGGINLIGNGIQLMTTGDDRVGINFMDVRGAGVVLFDKDDSHNYSSIEIPIGHNFGEFNYIMCFFKTNDGQYFGGTAYHPNGKEYCFTTMGGGSGTTDMSYLKGTRWVFNGTKATRKTTFEIGPGYSTAVNDAVLHIVAIVGFDYYKTSG